MKTDPAANQDDWDAHWESYAAAASRNPAQQMRHAMVVRLLGAGGADARTRILDIGSGQGDLLAKLRPALPKAELAGVELSARGVEISRRKVPQARFIVADLFQPPAELGDYVGWATHAVCSEVLEHVDDPVAFLRAARPLLARGARIVVTVPGGPMSAFDRHIGHRRHFDRASIRQVLEDAGYAVERTYLSGFPFFNLYRLVVIMRGERLVTDVEGGRHHASSRLADAMMALFRALFPLNFTDSPFGWQVVAIARKRPE